MAKDKKETQAPKDEYMKFSKIMWLDPRDPPLYQPDTVYLVPGKMVGRWLKRGGVIIPDYVPPKVEEPKAPEKAPEKEPVKEPVAPPAKKAEDVPKPAPQKPVAPVKTAGNKK